MACTVLLRPEFSYPVRVISSRHAQLYNKFVIILKGFASRSKVLASCCRGCTRRVQGALIVRHCGDAHFMHPFRRVDGRKLTLSEYTYMVYEKQRRNP